MSFVQPSKTKRQKIRVSLLTDLVNLSPEKDQVFDTSLINPTIFLMTLFFFTTQT